MRRRLAITITLLLLACSAPDIEAGGRSGGRSGGGHGGGHGSHGHHHHHGRGTVFLGVGPWWGGAWGGWPGWYYPYSPYPYYGYAPPAVAAEPPVYVERQLQIEAPAPGYWYYCESAGGYYPNVERCPQPWVKVPPRSP